MKNNTQSYINPYKAGFFLGLVLLASFLLLGAGLGASSGIARIGAFLKGLIFLNSGEYFSKWGNSPLHYYLVYMFLGTIAGGFISAKMVGRTRLIVEKGNGCSRNKRLSLAFTGGLLVGFSSRLAGGCTSGQALTGGALLLNGSFIFLISLFAAGYAMSFFVRRQWDD